MRKNAVLALLALLTIVLAVPIASSQELYTGGGGSASLDTNDSFSGTESSTTDSDIDSTSTSWDGGDADNDEGTSDSSTSDGTSTDDSTSDSGYSGGDADNDEGSSGGTTDTSGNYSGGDADNDEGTSENQTNETTDGKDGEDTSGTGDGTDGTGTDSGKDDSANGEQTEPPQNETPENETEPEEPGGEQPPDEPSQPDEPDTDGDDGDYFDGIIDIDLGQEETEFERISVYPRDLKVGERVSVEGKLSNFQTESVEVMLDGEKVALTSADSEGNFRTSFKVETPGEKTVEVKAGKASRSFQLNVRSEVHIQRISTATTLAPGRTSEVCTEIVSDSAATIKLYRNDQRVGEKNTRDEACFDVRFVSGDNRIRSVAKVTGDRDEMTVSRDLHAGRVESRVAQPKTTGGFFSSVPDVFRSRGGVSNAIIALLTTVLVVSVILWRY